MLNNQLLLQGATGYNLSKSLRFRSSASAYLNRTPASAGNRKTWTWSGWVKRGVLSSSSSYSLFDVQIDANNWFTLWYRNDTIGYDVSYTSSANRIILQSSAVYRDPSAYYHVILSVDTPNVTGANRIRIYINGTEIALNSYVTGSGYIAQNTDTAINSTNSHAIGRRNNPTPDLYFDGYLTEVNFIDGQALTPSSFGSTNSQTGVWQPKKYAGTYGTNGFYLPFTDVATTSGSNAGLGKDFSGNGNYWNTNNISVTAGATYDSMKDVPTLTNSTAGNYAVLNPLEKGSAFSVSNGNLTVDINSARPVFASVKGTIGITSGKYYWEFVKTSSGTGLVQVGVWASDNLSVGINTDLNGNLGSLTNIGMFGATSGNAIVKTGLSTQDSSTLGSYTNGDVIGIAFDADNGKLYAYKNGTELSGQSISGGTSILPTMATGKTYQPFVYSGNGGSGTETATTNINFGQRPFSYTPPTGFLALNTFNLPEPTIKAGNKHFDATTYTGNGSSKTISGLSFAPDLVWIKSRSNILNNQLFNIIQGTGKGLVSNSTGAEFSDADSLQSFTSDGYTLGPSAHVNTNSATFVGWQWKAGGSAVSNTAGSITSQVSANPSAGFSVVTWTGNGTDGATIGHGLGVTPAMWIIKNRANGTTNWIVAHKNSAATSSLANSSTITLTGFAGALGLNMTNAAFTYGFDTQVNGNTNGMVAYCFSEVAGYSKFGSYTGNGSTDGTFVSLPFKPKFIMVKCTNDISHWTIVDRASNPYNVAVNSLYADTSAAENATIMDVDFLSNGFKLRGVLANECNVNGYAYIYAAFAENPQKYSLGV